MKIITREQAQAIHREVIRAQLFEYADITREMQSGGIFMTRTELQQIVDDAFIVGQARTGSVTEVLEKHKI